MPLPTSSTSSSVPGPRRVRVVHIITRLIVGGAQENTVSTVLGLHARPDMDVRLWSGPSDGPEGSMEGEFASRPGVLTVVPKLVRPVRPWTDWGALRDLTARLERARPEIVHTHSGKAGILGRLAARRAGVPVIVHTIHGPSFGPFQGALANAVFRAAERRAARDTTHFISVADAMTRQYRAAGIGAEEQFTRIFSGFPLAPFLQARRDDSWRARWGWGPEDFVVGKIARLAELKGHDDLLAVAPELCRRVPRLKILLVGDGPLRAALTARVRSAGLEDRVRFTGLVRPDEIPPLLGVMDVVVHLSRREGLPRAVSQGLAAGRPVVAYDCDGTGEVCVTDETGFLLPAGDRAGLTRRLEQLAGDAALVLRLGRTGQERVRALFSVEGMVEEIHALYQRLLAAAHGRTKPGGDTK